MAKRVNELSAYQVRRITKVGMISVGGVAGLYLAYGGPKSKSWVLRADLNGARPELGLGSYPEVSLDKARERASQWKELMKQGIDPREEARKQKAARQAEALARLTFAEAADECWKSKAKGFKNAKHAKQWIDTLKEYAFPILGELYPEDIQTAHIVKVLDPIWHTLTDTASKVRQRMEAVISYAFALRQIEKLNPARWKANLDRLLPASQKLIRLKKKHHPRVPWQRMPVFWPQLRAKTGMGARMLELAILTSSRDTEVRGAKWEEFDLEAKRWRVPKERMKGTLDHDVPLPDAAVELLRALPRMADSPYVFWSNKGRTLSNGVMGKAIDDLHEADVRAGGIGFKDPAVDKVATPHGTARSSFKDWARRTSYADEVSELCLAHINSDATRAAYARDQLMDLRAPLLEQWALYLRTAAAEGNVIPIGSKRSADAQQAAAA